MDNINDPVLDMFIFENMQLLEQLEQSILDNEKSSTYSEDAINEIFRIMHTIKGSASMMGFNTISTIAHSIEDLFFFLREERPEIADYSSLTDLILEGVDFISKEMEKIRKGESSDGNPDDLAGKLKNYLSALKEGAAPKKTSKSNTAPKKTNKSNRKSSQPSVKKELKEPDANIKEDYFYKAAVFFEDGCEMENIRAYTIVNNLDKHAYNIFHIPQDLIDDEDSVTIIRQEGFTCYFNSKRTYNELNDLLNETAFIKSLELKQIKSDQEYEQFYEIKENHLKAITGGNDDKVDSTTEDGKSNSVSEKEKTVQKKSGKSNQIVSIQQSMISVSVEKLDKLMDLVGEMVISEAMVVQNPDLKGLELENFYKAARQLEKITSDLQDTVMSMRMVPISATFLKMHRMVRDICRKHNKEVELRIAGEETEVDKNLIEHISDPLMHLVRNAIDHGIESPEERIALGKSESGTLLLEAKNSGSDVLIIVKDDGRGLNKEKILSKAKNLNLIHKPEAEMTDSEIFNLILLPGFSTKDNVTELSGRGVGMDVVSKNIASIGGSIEIESEQEVGTTITLKIPLTLAIIDGMIIKVGSASYTIPTMSIIESFRVQNDDVFSDPDGNEMIMVRGQCYPVFRLHRVFNNKTEITDFSDGVLIMIKQDNRTVCVFADELIGQQPVVVKTLPKYIRRFKKLKGLAGCTLLGDGTISLILDIAYLTQL